MSNFLNVTAVPKIFIPAHERRKRRADEIIQIRSVVPPAPAAAPKPNLFIEIEDNGKQFSVQGIVTSTHILTQLEVAEAEPDAKCPKLDKANEEVALVDHSYSTPMGNPSSPDQPPIKKEKTIDGEGSLNEETSREPCPIISESELFIPDEEEPNEVIEDALPKDEVKLREYYSKFSKTELVEFLVDLRCKSK